MRWLKFNAVGAMGVAIQLALLTFLFHVVHMHYMLATGLSVEAAILHNFVWHRRWTWADRSGSTVAAGIALARFNLTSGFVSIGGNVFSAYILTGLWNIDPVFANLAAIAVGSVANLILSDRVVFVSRPGGTCQPNDPSKAGTD